LVNQVSTESKFSENDEFVAKHKPADLDLDNPELTADILCFIKNLETVLFEHGNEIYDEKPNEKLRNLLLRIVKQ